MTAININRQKLGLLDILDMVPALASIVAVAMYSAVFGVFRSQKDPPTLYLHVAYAILRKATLRLTPLQLQLISPTTDKLYLRYARSTGIIADTVELPHNTKGHWLGNKNAKHVLIWYHGGGFCLPGNMGYFKFWDQILKSANAAGRDLAIFGVTYDLAPHATYPTQLTQAVEALRYILGNTGLQPSQILLGGDSAGGNLVMGVLSHLAHPHPDIKKIQLKESLAGVACIAPWTSLDESNSDHPIYFGGDLLTPAVSKPWSRAYLGGRERDYYTDASDAPTSWLEVLPVNKILILGGESEVLLPVIEDFTEKLKVANLDVELFIGKREGHVAPVYNIYVGDNSETQQGRKLKIWLSQNLPKTL